MNQAEERTWEVVRRAYEERPVRSSHRRPRKGLVLAGVAAAVVVAAAVLSPPGRAVFERMREAVGVEHAAPALFSLPASGRLLVVSPGHGGVWLVRGDGLKRRLGSYQDAAWSPHGLYLVVSQTDELAAVTSAGDVRWSLARRGVRDPAWEGTRTDTRIAYIADSGLRVVGGDGTGDHLLDRNGRAVAPAWDPAGRFLYFLSARVFEPVRDEHFTDLNFPRTVKPMVVLYANDLEAMLDKVRAAGGVITRAIFSFPGGRRFHFLDPSGNELGVWSER